MALLDFFKRKKEVRHKGYSSKKPEKKPVKVSAIKKESVKETVEPVEKKNVPTAKPSRIRDGKAIGTRFSYETIKQPHISEKASYLAEKNQYIFEISPKSGGYPNKKEIKNAVEGIYGVDVLSVNIIKIPSKRRRLGKTEGFRKGYRKAVVKIKEGQKIEIL